MYTKQDEWHTTKLKPSEIQEVYSLPISAVKLHSMTEDNPLMNDEEFLELKNDIELNGQMEPVDLYKKNLIVDGRHRYLVLKELGIDTIKCFNLPYMMSLDDVEAIVKSRETRRHQTPTQKAIRAWKHHISGNDSMSATALKYGVAKPQIAYCSKISKSKGTDILETLFNGGSVVVDGKHTKSLANIYNSIKAEEAVKMKQDLSSTKKPDREVIAEANTVWDFIKSRDDEVLMALAKIIYNNTSK